MIKKSYSGHRESKYKYRGTCMKGDDLKSPYEKPAAGLSALTSSLKHILHEKALRPGVAALLRMNTGRRLA
jgi:hypothetical protein